MKKISVFAAIALGATLICGCSDDSVDTSKTPEQIKQEVASMDTAAIQKKVEAYQKALEEKAAELKAEAEKLTKIPLTELMGDDAKKIKASMEEIKAEVEKLTANMNAYAEGLKK